MRVWEPYKEGHYKNYVPLMPDLDCLLNQEFGVQSITLTHTHTEPTFLMSPFMQECDDWWIVRMSLQGRPVDVLVPLCRLSPATGRLLGAVYALGAFLRWRVGRLEQLERPRAVTEALERGDRSLLDLWLDAIDLTTPLMQGGPNRRDPYYRFRDVYARFAARWPRMKCSCGKTLARGERAPKVHTYLVSDPPYLKIGKTSDIKKRFPASGSTDNPRPLTVLATLCGDEEYALQGRFHRWHVRGEWFHDKPSIRAAFGLHTPRAVPQERPLLSLLEEAACHAIA